jgi:hypothetical protein
MSLLQSIWGPSTTLVFCAGVSWFDSPIPSRLTYSCCRGGRGHIRVSVGIGVCVHTCGHDLCSGGKYVKGLEVVKCRGVMGVCRKCRSVGGDWWLLVQRSVDVS